MLLEPPCPSENPQQFNRFSTDNNHYYNMPWKNVDLIVENLFLGKYVLLNRGDVEAAS